MEQKIRQQLTLFVNKEQAQEIEKVRQRFNPVQHRLINSHVTLCREDEIENTSAMLQNLGQLKASPIIINFGRATRFENGPGVLLPAAGDNEPFHLLRSKVLVGLHETIRRPAPHITLMHPGNSICTDEIFSVIQNIHFPAALTFDTISLIEQIGHGPWKTLGNFKLKQI